jgi:citrate synthase
MLVLLADHELNASTFAARVVASTRADVYACVAAALGAMAGPRHGAASDRMEALVAEIGRPEHAAAVANERTRRGEALPGFGHGFYDDGDPRAVPLLEGARALAPKARETRIVCALDEVMRDAGRPRANVDAAAVAVRAALGLPAGTAAGLFALSRTAGWIAHVLEQYEQGSLIRPRARVRAP